MIRWFPAVLLALAWATSAPAAGLLLPTDGSTPLSMVNHHVSVSIDEQVAITSVQQTFRNNSSRDLEATYVFPVPKGASVNKFSMWIDGKEVKGELVEADEARKIYTDIVRRMQDPGLLEYVGSNLLKCRVYPVPANGTQKLEVKFTAINEMDSGLVCYAYPLKADSKASTTEQDFRLDVTLKSKQAVQNVYSPTHPVKVTHKNDGTAHVVFEKKQASLDRDFQLYYSLGKGDVGLTGLCHRADAGQPGHVLFLISPRAELSKTQEIARDFVFVMDTSGSMAGPKMEQARRALLYCIERLGKKDRFAVLNFATVVGQYADGLSGVDKGTQEAAKKWVRDLQPTGGTAIDAALQAALALRTKDESRPFTVVFFTDGEPTVGETRPEQILKNVTDRNSSHTRIFTFGVGDDVNATLLDGIADATRAVSSYVRPVEDVEAKVSALFDKISHPVMTDLKLTVGETGETLGAVISTAMGKVTGTSETTERVKLTEAYPTKLPDLFHGGQVVVLARYTGKGAVTVNLTGKVGGEEKKLTYELTFPEKSGEERAFVEQLWARRKVGYLLDEIRRNGEKSELKEEVVKLAKKHGITTPYTSYLVVPDTVQPTAPNRRPIALRSAQPPGLGRPMTAAVPPPPRSSGPVPTSAPAGMPAPHTKMQTGSGVTYGASTIAQNQHVTVLNNSAAPGYAPAQPTTPAPAPAPEATNQFYSATPPQAQLREALQNGQANTGKLGVDLAVTLDEMRNNSRVGETKSRNVLGRNCVEINGVWVDDGYDAKMKAVRVKALSKAYFRMLEKEPKLSKVFELGTRVIWVTPSGAALVIDPTAGEEKMDDKEIEKLFTR